ncbi:MAG: ATP-binding protein [Candidatus Aenigmarchaeota archaeon]|nr:ATP-binding protein [Candidatus Aenigmarchaeota archaeon]
MKYFERNLLEELKKWTKRREMIIIKGPRQSGKTTLMKKLGEWLSGDMSVKPEDMTFITFEDREEMEKFSTDPVDFVKRYASDNGMHYLFIDEAQYCRDIGQKLKLIYDTYDDVKLFVTGSSSLEITAETSKYLVGRSFSFELHPFSFHEFLNARDKKLARLFMETKSDLMKLFLEGKEFKSRGKDVHIPELLKMYGEYVTYGGYPEVVKSTSDEERVMVIKNIFNTYLEKDVISYLQITDTGKFRKLVSVLSSITGGLVSYDKLLKSCGGYFKEITGLLDVLEQTYVVKFLRPFHKNMVTELRKSPKVYFHDYGLRNYAINNFNALDIRDDAGKLAENFVLNEVSSYSENMFINFWRTTAKAEVDIVLTIGERIVPIEVKFENMKEEKITRSFLSFIETYEPEFAIVASKDFWGERKIGKTTVKFIPLVYF